MTEAIQTILFDLDGTLLDTAPDLADALNNTLREYGRSTRPFEEIRPVVSHGGIALIKFGFEMEEQDAGFDEIRRRFLERYLENLAVKTRPFPGMEELLLAIEARDLNWGVVTNKPAWLTDPLMQTLDLTRRASCIVSGDTLEHRKPHPAPLLYACEQSGSRAPACLYVGDAQRDIEAGKRAGMHTLVALFGYIGEQDAPEQWGADDLVSTPLEILDWLNRFEQGDIGMRGAQC